jgi:ankyrin repeat protein
LKAASETDDAAEDQEPPLIAAARVGQTGEVSSLVEDLPSSIDVRNKEGETALMVAAENNHAGTVAVLVEKDCDVNARNKVRTYAHKETRGQLGNSTDRSVSPV